MFTCHKFSAVVYLHASSDILSSSAPRHCISEAVCREVFYQSPAVSTSESLKVFKSFFLAFSLFVFFFFTFVSIFSLQKVQLLTSVFKEGTLKHFPLKWLIEIVFTKQATSTSHPSCLLKHFLHRLFYFSKSHRCTTPQSHASTKKNWGITQTCSGWVISASQSCSFPFNKSGIQNTFLLKLLVSTIMASQQSLERMKNIFSPSWHDLQHLMLLHMLQLK